MSGAISYFPVRIYYDDTDTGGLVYHANYLKYIERARTELLRELGIKQSLFLEQDIAFVIKRISIDYQLSAKLDDLLNVSTSITKLKRASVEFYQEVLNQEGEVICKAVVLIACVNVSNTRPCVMPKQLLGAFESVC